jgi:hypothetical protein
MTYSKLSMSLLVKYSKIFPDEVVDIEALLRPYGRKLVLQMVGVLNAVLQKGIKSPADQLRSWFGQEHPLAREIFEIIYFAYRKSIADGENVYIVNDYANLRLNEVGSSFEEVENNSELDVDVAHLDLFKAYLWINEEYLQKQENISKTIPEGTTGIDKAAWMATATLLSYYDFTYSDQEYIFLAQLIKASYCFDFIEAYHPEAFNLYLDSMGIKSFRDYAKKITPLAMLCFTDLVSISVEESNGRAFLEMFDHKQDMEETNTNKDDYDFLQIRNHPLFKIENNLYLLLNRSMVINKVYTSIYWDMKAIFVANPQFEINEDKFRQDYTGDFSEEWLVYKLLEKAYGNKKYKRFSGAEMKAIIGNTEPDYYIRNGNKLFLYEVKDSFIAGKYKQTFNVIEIEKELKRKYLGKNTNGGEKAVKQLVTRVRMALVKDYTFDTAYDVRNLNIYPILIVYDINLTVPGVERALMKWFSEEMKSLDTEMVGIEIKGYKVNDLVILHIDGLVMLSEYLFANKLKMEDLINSYLERYRKLLKQTEDVSFENLKANVLNSYLSFQHHVMDTVLAIKLNDRLVPRELKMLD